MVWRWDAGEGAGKASKLSDLVLGRIAWPCPEIEETERGTLGKNARVDVDVSLIMFCSCISTP